MKEIKFRAWLISQKKMTYKPYGDEYCCEGTPINDIFEPGNQEAVGHILMRYTGLKDKNGTDIYEGDIVRYKWLPIFEEDNGDCSFSEKIIGWEFNEVLPVTYNDKQMAFCFGDISYARQYIRNEIEVIGNIKENPEILT